MNYQTLRAAVDRLLIEIDSNIPVPSKETRVQNACQQLAAVMYGGNPALTSLHRSLNRMEALLAQLSAFAKGDAFERYLAESYETLAALRKSTWLACISLLRQAMDRLPETRRRVRRPCEGARRRALRMADSRRDRQLMKEFSDPPDICGLCGEAGADKVPHPHRWPGERAPGTELVHASCEDEECRRAHAALTDKQREDFLNSCR